jgi:hypothetical protein
MGENDNSLAVSVGSYCERKEKSNRVEWCVVSEIAPLA